MQLLSSHSRGDKSSYGYQFVPYVTPSIEDLIWYVPEKLKNSADHGDEVNYVFGAAKITKEMLEVYGGKSFEIIIFSTFLISVRVFNFLRTKLIFVTMTRRSSFILLYPHPSVIVI